MPADLAASIASNSTQEINWDTIVSHLKEKSCVLVLGPSVLCQKNEKGEDVPVRRILAQRIGQEIERVNQARFEGRPRPSLPDPGDLALMTSLYLQEETGSETEFETLLQEFFKGHTQPSELLVEIAKLNIPLVLNTTPDQLMKVAYSRTSMRADFKYYTIDEGKPLEVVPIKGRPLVYNLFGSLEERKSLVLSQAHQMKFLDKIKDANAGLPTGLRVLLEQAKSVIFLGFDFENWYMRVFSHLLNFNGKAQKIYAIHYTGSLTSPPPLPTRKFFELQNRMQFVDLKPDEFVKTVHQKLVESNGKEKAPAPVALRKLLFLHHIDDLEARDKMQELLKPVLSAFHFEVINWFEAGDIDERMEENIATAEVIVPLISGSFSIDEKMSNAWLQKALDRKGNNCLVLPWKIRPVNPFGHLWGSMENIEPFEKALSEDETAWQTVPDYFQEIFNDNYGT